MPIPLPNLDNRTYQDLVAELRALIPRYAPAWTDHNPSDPGITLLELFAWVTEGLIYRANRIPDASRENFLRLLGAAALAPGADLEAASKEVIDALRARSRAITAEDVEALVLDPVNYTDSAVCPARARCLMEREPGSGDAARPGHVTVIIVPGAGLAPSKDQIRAVEGILESCRLVTSRLHVVGPVFTPIQVIARLVTVPGGDGQGIQTDALAALARFFDPLQGGPEGGGWPFGRDVHASEACQVLEGVARVDHIESLRVYPAGQSAGAGTRVAVDPNALVEFRGEAQDVEVVPA